MHVHVHMCSVHVNKFDTHIHVYIYIHRLQIHVCFIIMYTVLYRYLLKLENVHEEYREELMNFYEQTKTKFKEP